MSEMFAYRIASGTAGSNDIRQEFENKLEAITLINRKAACSHY